MKKGKFIVFEGGDGCGKTTQIKLLAKELKKQGKKVLVTHEPGGTKIADMIRQVILHHNHEEVVPKAELLLFLASRAQHVHHKVLPALEKGTWVLCDRFSGSTFAYQIGARKLPEADFIKKIDAYAKSGLKEDLVFHLDLDPKKGIERKSKNNLKFNRLDNEKLKFHQAVRRYFIKLAKQKNWVKVNADQEVEEVKKDIYEIISKKTR